MWSIFSTCNWKWICIFSCISFSFCFGFCALGSFSASVILSANQLSQEQKQKQQQEPNKRTKSEQCTWHVDNTLNAPFSASFDGKVTVSQAGTKELKQPQNCWGRQQGNCQCRTGRQEAGERDEDGGVERGGSWEVLWAIVVRLALRLLDWTFVQLKRYYCCIAQWMTDCQTDCQTDGLIDRQIDWLTEEATQQHHSEWGLKV